jgi:hypothetical protein
MSGLMILVLIALESLVGAAVKVDQFTANCFQIVLEVATVLIANSCLSKTKIGLSNERDIRNPSI